MMSFNDFSEDNFRPSGRVIFDKTDFSALFSETPWGKRKSLDLTSQKSEFECNSTVYKLSGLGQFTSAQKVNLLNYKIS